jgi:tight adherence protein C
MDLLLVGSLAVGALFAAGVLVLAVEALPAAPALGAALHRLHPELPSPARPRLVERLLRQVPLPSEDLALLGRTTGQHATSLAVAVALGLAAPVLLGVLLAASGRSMSGPLVAAGGLLGPAAAVGLAFVVHRDVAFRARRLRRDCRSMVAVYLSLVAMQRGAGHGSVESLERAGQVGDGWVVQRIREALLRARSHRRPPWNELTELGGRLGIPELSDVGQIMQSAGQSGAQVHRSLLDRAASLRDQIRADALARAEAVTGKLEIPGAVLLVVLAAFVIYPITQRVYLGG